MEGPAAGPSPGGRGKWASLTNSFSSVSGT